MYTLLPSRHEALHSNTLTISVLLRLLTSGVFYHKSPITATETRVLTEISRHTGVLKWSKAIKRKRNAGFKGTYIRAYESPLTDSIPTVAWHSGVNIAVVSTLTLQPMECYAIMHIHQNAKNVCSGTPPAACCTTIPRYNREVLWSIIWQLFARLWVIW